MEFYSRITIPQPSFSFSYNEQTILLGSCFVENIGKKLEENKFPIDLNPFGILYNPSSIANAIRLLIKPTEFKEKDLFQKGGIYHSFFHHSRFSSSSESECLKKINEQLALSAQSIRTAKRIIITFGTAWVYQLKESGKIVSNCHKLPEKLFHRRILTTSEIVEEWQTLLQELWGLNPDIKILFTVSPIRHWKDGAHHNQLSKATLLLAIDELQQTYPEQIAYFPSYEIMMDELRDYRFYADDLFHPSAQAIEYIWERFYESMFSKDTFTILKEWEEIQKAIQHKPFHPQSEAYKRFISQTLLKIELFKKKFPFFDIAKEIEEIKKKI
ncbi:MAG: GSCFA domain-containing protein [Parabacteroides sp.]|nr:GSCFA domain-containing protein [Parabacteroides sp.]